MRVHSCNWEKKRKVGESRGEVKKVNKNFLVSFSTEIETWWRWQWVLILFEYVDPSKQFSQNSTRNLPMKILWKFMQIEIQNVYLEYFLLRRKSELPPFEDFSLPLDCLSFKQNLENAFHSYLSVLFRSNVLSMDTYQEGPRFYFVIHFIVQSSYRVPEETLEIENKLFPSFCLSFSHGARRNICCHKERWNEMCEME